jgi:TonB family protein
MRNKEVADRSLKIKIGVGILLFALIAFVASFLFIGNSDKKETIVISQEIKPEVIPENLTKTEIEQEKPAEVLIAKEQVSKPKIASKTSKKVALTTDYKEALPKGGYDQLFKFFEKSIQYPSVAKANKIEGTVMVEFYINAEGKAEEIGVVKSISHELNEEAIRLVTMMPAWNPATYDGNKIATKIVLPLNFKLER